jgi:cytochrome P450
MIRRPFTTAQLLTNVLFDLATRLEYVQLLRREAQLIHAQNGGEWTLESMGQLKKIDSFIKESQRHFTAAAITFHRKTLKRLFCLRGPICQPTTTTYFPHQQLSPATLQPTRFLKSLTAFA